MNILIVVAHPDDEVLGCGMTGAALAAAGHTVRACFVSADAQARTGRPDGDGLQSDMQRAQASLGFGAPILGRFPNLRLNTVPHLELVQLIENALLQSAADVLFTHHPGDVNDDHVQVSRACQAAARLFQRRAGVPRLRRLYYMEVLSSTDWAMSGGAESFRPDTFVGAESFLDRKLEALRCYRGVMRPAPHPRSDEVVRGLAHYRGGQSGFLAAEAFQTGICTGSAIEVLGA
jgi:LmbE family N-acetylglucosaminyl deacetylase